MNSHSTDLLGMKFSYDNSYIVIAPVADPHNNQDTTMQQLDQTQNAQNITEQVKKTIIDGTDTQVYQKGMMIQALLLASHAKQYIMDTDTISNAIVESIKIPHCSYSLVVKNKNQILQEMELVDSSGWPDIVKTHLTIKHKSL
ncbi:32959_t:CDS:2 [Gigaspora margarita]|uniref:32959_t:CDS:1 n=1 Tax=Gigaspora margarita TaxID=4874 RepID=A0ABN7UKZ8_GIGMA|nr:32959_t:CDS:2 [Gigaspora margarita]